MSEVATFTFASGDEELLGLVHQPDDADAGADVADGKSDRGVLIVVGGPQYRVGAHRQFVHLARKIAAAGLPVLRFDYTGMGDSSGDFPGFENVGTDVEAAVRAMKQQCPGIRKITVWGLCDGASVALLDAASIDGVDQLILVNPWVWSEDSEATTMTRHYYAKRFISIDFWRSVLSGRVRILAAIQEYLQTVFRAARAPEADHPKNRPDNTDVPIKYQNLMANALGDFDGRVLILLSDNDLVARDFEDRLQRDKLWRDAVTRTGVDVQHIENADHTFSRGDWKNAAAKASIRWIQDSDPLKPGIDGGQ